MYRNPWGPPGGQQWLAYGWRPPTPGMWGHPSWTVQGPAMPNGGFNPNTLAQFPNPLPDPRRAGECLFGGDVKVTRRIAERVTQHAIDRFGIRDLVNDQDIARARGEMYNFLKWKLGSPSAVCAQYTSAGMGHFERTYSDEAAAILLGVLSFADVGRPELRLPKWFLDYMQTQYPGMKTGCTIVLEAELGIPSYVGRPLCNEIVEALERQLPLAATFIPKRYDVDDRLVREAIAARRRRRPDRREPRRPEVRPLPAGEEAQAAELMRRVNDWGFAHGYVGGFPNFHQARYDGRLVFGATLPKTGYAEVRDIARDELGGIYGFEDRFRAVNDWAGAHGYAGGYPNMHEAIKDGRQVFGVILFKKGSLDWRDVPAAELGNPQGIMERFRAVNDYAGAHGYVGGFPNFHQAEKDGQLVYGVFLIKEGAAVQRDIPATELAVE